MSLDGRQGLMTAPAVDPEPPFPGMVWVPGKTYLMGSDQHYPEERPAHRVTVDGFWMDRCPVTNERFAGFVAETGHLTLAEIVPDAAQYPGALPHMLYAGSLLFVQPDGPVDRSNITNWWTFKRGADWRHPQGPSTSLDGADRHPVVHVAFADAEAFAAWEGKTLPSEAEWELAARAVSTRRPARRTIRADLARRRATIRASRRSSSPARSSREGRISARRTIAAGTGRQRASPSRSTRRPPTSASDASSGRMTREATS